MKDNIWEEKNLIETKTSCENKSELETKDIIKNTETKSFDAEWKDTGKNWIKNCPKCGNEITFSNKGNYTASVKENCLCRTCSNFLKRWNRNKLPNKKFCLVCGKEINHRRNFCSKKCFDNYQTLPTTPCAVCSKPSKYGKKHCSRKCLMEEKLKERTRNCLYCKCDMTDYKKTRFCSYKCMGLYKLSQRHIKKCKLCGKNFTNVVKRIKFCCHTCSVIFQLKYGNRISKPELKVREMLKELGIEFVSSYPIENKVFDIFIPSKNLLIEVDGIYWHGRNKNRLNNIQKKNIENDQIKNGLVIKYGYTLLRVWEDDIKNVPEYIL